MWSLIDIKINPLESEINRWTGLKEIYVEHPPFYLSPLPLPLDKRPILVQLIVRIGSNLVNVNWLLKQRFFYMYSVCDIYGTFLVVLFFSFSFHWYINQEIEYVLKRTILTWLTSTN